MRHKSGYLEVDEETEFLDGGEKRLLREKWSAEEEAQLRELLTEELEAMKLSGRKFKPT